MSIDEARNQKALALLEFHEAKEDAAAVRRRVEDLATKLKVLAEYAVAIARHNEHYDRNAGSLRARIVADAGYREAMNIDALLALDDQAIAAAARLENAKAVKRTFGIED